MRRPPLTASPARTALTGLAALAVAIGIGRFAFTPILPMMQADFALGLPEGGWLASANYAGYLAGALSAVGLRLPAARAIRWGLAAVVLSTLAMGLTTSFAAWLALRGAAGVASAWVLVFGSAWSLERLARSSPPPRLPRLAAVVYSGVGVGIALAGAACAALIARGARSSTAWIALGLVSLAATALPWREIGTPGPTGPAPAAAGRARRWDPAWALPVACYGAFGFGYIVPATFLAAMARAALPDPAVYGWSWPIFGAAAAASTLAASALRGRLGERAVWAAGHVVMAAGVVVPALVRGLPGIVLSALLVGGTFMVVTMAGMQEARRLAGADARPLMAAMTSAFAAGQIAGPLLVGALAARGAGYRSALVLAGGVLLAGALALARPRGRRRGRERRG